MSRRDLLEAELEVADLEEKLVKAKGTKAGPSHELKLELREARQRFRELRGNPTPGPGDAVASPEPVKASAKARK